MLNQSVALIVFRESLEIAMILGVVLAATRGLSGRAKWIGLGFAGGMAGACCVALFAGKISALAEGMGQEFFNAIILFAAAIVIGWTAVWMHSHAREMAAHLKQIGRDVSEGKLPGASLSLVIGLALLREGSEIVLFLYGQWIQDPNLTAILLGSGEGLALGIICGLMLYYGLIKLSARYMLKVTGWLLVLLVAGLSAQGAQFLSSAGYFPGLSYTMWNSSWLLSDDRTLAKALHTLVGYTARPSAISLMFYVGSLVFMLAVITFNDRKKMLPPVKLAV